MSLTDPVADLNGGRSSATRKCLPWRLTPHLRLKQERTSIGSAQAKSEELSSLSQTTSLQRSVRRNSREEPMLNELNDLAEHSALERKDMLQEGSSHRRSQRSLRPGADHQDHPKARQEANAHQSTQRLNAKVLRKRCCQRVSS